MNILYVKDVIYSDILDPETPDDVVKQTARERHGTSCAQGVASLRWAGHEDFGRNVDGQSEEKHVFIRLQ